MSEFVGSSLNVSLEGREPMPTRVSFIHDNRLRDRLRNIEAFRCVLYHDLYQGIDLEYKATAGNLKTTYIVAPKADPTSIHLRYSGMRSLNLNSEGELVLTTDLGELRELAPLAYQVVDLDSISPVEVKYLLDANGDVTFSLGSYDRARPLLIDPTIVHSSVFGGSGTTVVTAVASDAFGRYYMTGWTTSLDFSTSTGYQTQAKGEADAFVAAWDSLSNTFVYTTYLGGRGDDRGSGIVVDGLGNAIVVGSTYSGDFPQTGENNLVFPSRYRSAFVTKLDPQGRTLLYSTLVASDTYGEVKIAQDSQFNVYIAGTTSSDSLPLLAPYQPRRGGGRDVFVMVLASGGSLKRATYFGGSGDDEVAAIAVDARANVYLTGGTTSQNFPLMRAFQKSKAGGMDAFVSVFDGNGRLTFSTLLGGSGTLVRGLVERGTGIAVDDSLFCYVTGDTNSTDFPTTVDARYPKAFGQFDGDVFLAKIDVVAGALLYSSYWGGTGDDHATGLALEKRSDGYVVHLVGFTSSEDLPQVAATQSVFGGGYEAFLATMRTSPQAEEFSTYLGGSGNDAAYVIALGGRGHNLVVAGGTASADFPAVSPITPATGGDVSGFFAETQVGSDIAVAITANAVDLAAGQSRQFQASVTGTANGGVTWSLTPMIGTISSSGLYVAPATISGQQSVTVTATSVADPTKFAHATITLRSGNGIAVTVSPTTTQLLDGQILQLYATVTGTANAGVTWSLTPMIGTISSSGLYVAPATISGQQSVTATATSVADPTKTSSATVVLLPRALVEISIYPLAAARSAGSTQQQFNATVTGVSNTAVTWSLTPPIGTIFPTGLYIPPPILSTQQAITVTATSAVDPTKSASALLTLFPNAQVRVSVSPQNVSLRPKSTQQFRAQVDGTFYTDVNWSISPQLGTMSFQGLYTAPQTVSGPTTVTVTATSVIDPTVSNRVTISVSP